MIRRRPASPHSSGACEAMDAAWPGRSHELAAQNSCRRRSSATRPPGNKAIPEGLWSKCPACEAVLYRSDLESNLNVCPEVRPPPAHPGASAHRPACSIPRAASRSAPRWCRSIRSSSRTPSAYPDRLRRPTDTGEADALLVDAGARSRPCRWSWPASSSSSSAVDGLGGG